MAETKKNKQTKKETAPAAGPITAQMGIGEIVRNYPETMEVFVKYGMHCIGCAAAHFENLGQGCAAHGIDAEAMVRDMNAVVAKKPKKQ